MSNLAQEARVTERNIVSRSGPQDNNSLSRAIDERIRELGDWRGRLLSELRAWIRQADPAVIEQCKWRGVPVWWHDGMICTGETYKNAVS